MERGRREYRRTEGAVADKIGEEDASFEEESEQTSRPIKIITKRATKGSF